MKLKKINPGLAEALAEAGFTEPTDLQKETFGTLKSGADCVIGASKEEGKTTAIVINVIQKLDKAFQQSPRALIVVETKEKMLEVLQLFRDFGQHTDLRVYGVHDKGDIDYDKNQISVGIDVLVGTVNRLGDMFSSAGFDVNQLKMFVVDDTETLLKHRLEPKIARISNSIAKTQRIFFTDVITERVELLADRLMIEPVFFEFDDLEEEKEEYEDEETNETE
ncbi:DEAD/DEAH box helicase [Flavobacterium sp. Sd200]|uniref:DEAD/DEAH box helicase n=1 Tax=Flavobacterium sp. Sd200 TaxID=2692211 RepID=UPI00136AE8F1|nr:DEAD/DEAH box helicase [Flavobacterium sp. Sd200]MXN90068.1 DEAD/DEAH box helicase [Flavobacterium sp. Sd200]